MARRIHEPIEKTTLDVGRARAWLYAARNGSRTTNENEAVQRASFKLTGEIMVIWRNGEETSRLPEAVEKARALLITRGYGFAAERADAASEDPGRVPNTRLVGALLGLAVV
jgi:hypothetical protein